MVFGSHHAVRRVGMLVNMVKHVNTLTNLVVNNSILMDMMNIPACAPQPCFTLCIVHTHTPHPPAHRIGIVPSPSLHPACSSPPSPTWRM